MDIKDFVIVNPLTGEEKYVSEFEYQRYRAAVNSFCMKHRRRGMCRVEHYNKAVALCPMDCSICDYSCERDCVSLDEMFEENDPSKCCESSLIDYNSPDVIYDNKVLYKKLNESVKSLSSKQRKICELIMEGKNFAEIGRIMNTDRANILRIFERAKKALISELKEYI